MIFDTHAHYDDSAFNDDRDELLKSLPSFGIAKVCNIGASLSGSRKSLLLSEKYDHIYSAVGIHPDECGSSGEGGRNDNGPGMGLEKAIDELALLAAHEKCVAIGEIGLDYHGFDIYKNKPSKEVQLVWFRRQLELAAELCLPVSVHSRNASGDTLSEMCRAHEKLHIKKAVLHCFSYSRETAVQYAGMGYYLGFGGSVTYEGQKKITKVLSAVPLDRIVLETDCPYLSPVPKRGERNDSRNLVYVRDKVAEIKGISPKELEEIAYENSCRLYGL